MSEPTAEPTAPRASLRQLRWWIAGVCKDLMRARLISQPTAFTPAELEAWKVTAKKPPHFDWQFLNSAAANLGRLLDACGPEYEPSSLGDPDDERPEERAFRGCMEVVGSDGGERPDKTLFRLAEQVRHGTAADWWNRFWWDGLADLRDQLNLLPEVEGLDRPRVHWDPGTGELQVDGVWVITLKERAKNLRRILDRFQAAGWAIHVTFHDTRTSGNRRLTWLENARKDLNKLQQRIKFEGDGSGDGVYYRIISDAQPDGSDHTRPPD